MVTTINRGLKIIKVMSAEIKNLKNLQNTEYSLKKLFDEARKETSNYKLSIFKSFKIHPL